jgi:hypothetical protein
MHRRHRWHQLEPAILTQMPLDRGRPMIVAGISELFT